MIIEDGKYRKIKVLKDIQRESYFTGEMMGWKAGEFEEAWVGLEYEQLAAEVNWG